MIRLIGWFTAASLLLALTIYSLVPRTPPTPIHQLEDVRERLAGAGLVCIPDRANGEMVTGFLVSRDPGTWADLNMLCKVGPMGPEWKGKVWFAIDSQAARLQAIPDGAAIRIFGNIVAYGDAGLLSELTPYFPS